MATPTTRNTLSRAARSLVPATALLLAAGCALAPQIHFDASSAAKTTPVPARVEDDELIGLALSGGGSRAAVFAAAGMEALREHGLLRRVDFVSSVSGGSMASAYFAKATAVDGESPDDEAFFERFQNAMRYSYQGSIGARQFWKFRWFSPSRRATSFMEVLDDRFLDNVSLGDVSESRPRLLINATLYDNGRRFVFTTLPQQEVEFEFASLRGSAQGLAAHRAIRPATFADEEFLGGVPGELPLSLAVAASAGVPLLIGPVAIQVDDKYWHLGDGGLYDNSGIETLEQLFAQLARRDGVAKTRMILALDSISYANEEELIRNRKFGVSRHAEFIVDIPTARAEAYRDAAWGSIGLQQGGRRVETVVMRYTDADLDPARLPASCRGAEGLCPEESCRPALRRRLGAVPTRLHIDACDADLIEQAAHHLVHRQLAARFSMREPCPRTGHGGNPWDEAGPTGKHFN